MDDECECDVRESEIARRGSVTSHTVHVEEISLSLDPSFPFSAMHISFECNSVAASELFDCETGTFWSHKG